MTLVLVAFIAVTGWAVSSALSPAPVWAHDGNSSASVVHACVAKNDGSVRIVGVSGACKKNETTAHWSIAGPQGPAGGGLRVVDSNGAVVGLLVGGPIGDTTVIMSFAGTQFVVVVKRGRIHPATRFESDMTRFFESTDCTGTPYFLSSFLTEEFFEVFTLSVDGTTLLYSDPSLAQARQLRSFNQGVPPGACQLETINGLATPISTTPVIPNFGFVPPFRVE